MSNEQIKDEDCREILDRAGIDLGGELASVEVDDADAPVVLSVLTGLLRLEESCAGTLARAAEVGVLERCIDRLWEIEDDNARLRRMSPQVRIVAEAILRELEGWRSGRKATTYSMLRRVCDNGVANLSDFERRAAFDIMGNEGDMFDLEYALFEYAPAHGLILDKSAHEGLAEGLPFHIDFVVRHIRSR